MPGVELPYGFLTGLLPLQEFRRFFVTKASFFRSTLESIPLPPPAPLAIRTPLLLLAAATAIGAMVLLVLVVVLLLLLSWVGDTWILSSAVVLVVGEVTDIKAVVGEATPLPPPTSPISFASFSSMILLSLSVSFPSALAPSFPSPLSLSLWFLNVIGVGDSTENDHNSTVT